MKYIASGSVAGFIAENGIIFFKKIVQLINLANKILFSEY